MFKKLLLALGILTSVSMYAVPTLNVYDFEVKKDKEASYKSITEDYVNKTMGTEQGVLGLFAATDERDKTTSFIVEIYNDYLAFSNHTKNQTSKDFKAVIPQIAEGNLNSTEVDIQIAKDKKVERASLTGGNITYMNAVENEIVAGRSLIAQDYKDVASVILLDQELANSLFGSAQEAVNKIIDVGGFSYRVIGVYTSDEAKAVKTFGIGGLPITTNISLANNFNMDEISCIVKKSGEVVAGESVVLSLTK